MMGEEICVPKFICFSSEIEVMHSTPVYAGCQPSICPQTYVCKHKMTTVDLEVTTIAAKAPIFRMGAKEGGVLPIFRYLFSLYTDRALLREYKIAEFFSFLPKNVHYMLTNFIK